MKVIVITPNGEAQPYVDTRPEVHEGRELRLFKNGYCIAIYLSHRWSTLIVTTPEEESGPDWKMIAQDLAAAIGVGAQTTQGAMERYREAMGKS